jgi:hypothetical protein
MDPMLRAIIPTCLLALLLTPLAGPAAASDIFRLEDPRGDDFGAGDLVYPNDPDFEPGSLDLEFLSARAAGDGTWFKARMGRPIRSPVGRVTSLGAEPLEQIVRNGFYTFNIDIYIDTDRVAGSGRIDTMPGRMVSVHRDSAWEKAVILTPRPQVARSWYVNHLVEQEESLLRAGKGRVDRDDMTAIEARVEAQVSAQVFFPNRVRVRGREIEFFVPAEFLGGTARPDWAYTVLVTGADVEQATKVLNISPGAFSLMAMPVARGRAPDRWGIIQQGDFNQPPVIDMLAPTVAEQQRVLSDYDVVEPRLAAVPGIAPDGREAVAGAPAPPRGASPAGTAPRVTPATPSAASGVASGAAPATPGETSRRTIPARLRTLNELRDEGLVTEEEYQRLRRKILSEI